jgi:hypothetical protein
LDRAVVHRVHRPQLAGQPEEQRVPVLLQQCPPQEQQGRRHGHRGRHDRPLGRPQEQQD